MDVHIFIPCFIDQVYPNVGFSMVKILEKAGCNVIYNPNQTCCGQPAFNAGFRGEAKEVCTKFLDDFKEAHYIVAPSASCVGFIRNYMPELFGNTPQVARVHRLKDKTFELSDFLVNVLKIEDFGATFEHTITYHDSCASIRECHIKEEPRKLLNNVRGLQLIEMNESETCCGFGGTFAVKFASISTAMADQKVTNALATEAEYIVSTDMSCLMNIEGCIGHKGSNLKVMHLADILASGW